MMIWKQGLISLYVGITIYLILILFFGETGNLAYKKLEHYEQELEKNIRELERVNDQLYQQVESLMGDTWLLKLESRKLGYYKDSEGIIKVEGISPSQKPVSPGKIVNEEIGQPKYEAFIRAISLSIGSIVFFILLLMKRKAR